jgi:Cu/Ag efflux pump CusA
MTFESRLFYIILFITCTRSIGRMIPILMTAIAAALALFPILLVATGWGWD